MYLFRPPKPLPRRWPAGSGGLALRPPLLESFLNGTDSVPPPGGRPAFAGGLEALLPSAKILVVVKFSGKIILNTGQATTVSVRPGTQPHVAAALMNRTRRHVRRAVAQPPEPRCASRVAAANVGGLAAPARDGWRVCLQNLPRFMGTKYLSVLAYNKPAFATQVPGNIFKETVHL